MFDLFSAWLGLLFLVPLSAFLAALSSLVAGQ